MGNKVQSPAVNVNDVSRISTGTVVRGNISSPSDLRIDGDFEGNIRADGRVVVGDKANVNGLVTCENADLWGTVTGKVYVRDTLTLKDSCRINGEIHVNHLVVELGAEFEGTCGRLSGGEFEKVSSVEGQPDPAGETPSE